jgi:hypothetical protein
VSIGLKSSLAVPGYTPRGHAAYDTVRATSDDEIMVSLSTIASAMSLMGLFKVMSSAVSLRLKRRISSD